MAPVSFKEVETIHKKGIMQMNEKEIKTIYANDLPITLCTAFVIHLFPFRFVINPGSGRFKHQQGEKSDYDKQYP